MRMKMKRPHLVPIPTQALDLVPQLKVMSGQYLLVFPERNYLRKTMSGVSINQVFKIIGDTEGVTENSLRLAMSTVCMRNDSIRYGSSLLILVAK